MILPVIARSKKLSCDNLKGFCVICALVVYELAHCKMIGCWLENCKNKNDKEGYIYIYICVCVCVCEYVSVYMCEYRYIYIYILYIIYIYIYLYTRTHTHTYIYICTHTYIHSRINTHTHTYIYIYILKWKVLKMISNLVYRLFILLFRKIPFGCISPVESFVALADGLSPESERKQVSSNLQNSYQYFSRSY